MIFPTVGQSRGAMSSRKLFGITIFFLGDFYFMSCG